MVCSKWAESLPVGGDHRPVVLQHLHLPGAGVQHRLQGQDHARLQARVGPGGYVVGDLRLLVQRETDAVAAELAHHLETVGAGVLVDRRGNLADPVAGHRGLHPAGQALTRDGQQARPLGGDRAHRQADRGVAEVAAQVDADVQADDVPGAQLLPAGDAVDDLFVDRDAEGGREVVVAQEGRLPSPLAERLAGEVVQLGGADPFPHQPGQLLEGPRQDGAGLPDPGDLA